MKTRSDWMKTVGASGASASRRFNVDRGFGPTCRGALHAMGIAAGGGFALAGPGSLRGQTACAVLGSPSLTEGPYFVDEDLNRSDIRVDPETGSVEAGVPLSLAINISQLVECNQVPLSGAYVDIWRNAAGVYNARNARDTLNTDDGIYGGASSTGSAIASNSGSYLMLTLRSKTSWVEADAKLICDLSLGSSADQAPGGGGPGGPPRWDAPGRSASRRQAWPPAVTHFESGSAKTYRAFPLRG